MSLRRLLVGTFVAVAAGLLSASGGLSAPRAGAPTPSPAPAATPGAAASAQPGSSPSPTSFLSLPLFGNGPAAGAPTQPYVAFMRGATSDGGVIDLVRKDDELYLDLKPANFGTPYIILPSIASGVGGDAYAGRVYDPMVVIFKRVGKRVMWITPNARYVADKGTAAAASLAVSVADSVIQSSPIVSESPDGEHIVINPSIFLSDFEGIGADLGKGVKQPSLPGLLVLSIRPSFSVDLTKSYYLDTKAFPLNDEISVNLTFNGPPNALPTVPDGRGIPIVVHYSIVAPPAHDPNYVPRYADDRIGYFVTARKHFGNDMTNPPIERFIDRWNLDAGPIVFTLTNEIPPEYRDTVRRAILVWNTAFARIGYPHAIEVRDPPNDPHFDPEDARYNSVRWITSDSPGFVALSPHVADPETGQIIRAEVVIDGESVRIVRRGYVDRVAPAERARASAFALPADDAAAPDENDADESADVDSRDDIESLAGQAALGMSALMMHPGVTPESREKYTQAFLFGTVIHEVGHTLGLRHNFEGSTAFTYAELHDPAFTAAHGVTGSVMDYNPANLAGPHEHQATYFPDRLGPYDLWAIQFGYQNFHAATSDAELPALDRIADESTRPGLAFGTDEDASGPLAVDPRIQAFDLSSDALAFAASELAIDDQITQTLTHRYQGDTRSYQDLRQTFVTTLNNDLSAATVASRYIGGIYTSRSHRGQPGASAPFSPVPRTVQRRAFELLDRYVLSAHALSFPPALLNEVAPAHFDDWSSTRTQRTDFPIEEVVAELQDDTIASVFNARTLARIADESLKAPPGATMDLADLFEWTNDAIFDDLGAPSIPPIHRELQRRFADLEMEIAFLPSTNLDQLGLPREVQSLARYELRRERARLNVAYRNARDVGTKAHLDDLRSRIDGVLNPREPRPL